MAKFTNELTIDVRPFLEALKKATAAAGGDVKKLEQELSGIEADIKIQADTNQARSAIGQLQAEVAGLGDEQVRVSADTGEARTNTQQLGAEIAGLGDTAEQAGDDIKKKVGDPLDDLKKRFKGGLLAGVLGAGVAGAVSTAIGAVTNLTGAAFDEYKKLDSSIQNIGTLGVEAAGLSLERFKQLATDLSTQLPDTAGNIANGIYNAISAGITGTEEEIAGFVEVAGKVAVAGLSDTNTAVNALTSVVNAYGLGVEGADEVSNTFFAAIKAGKTSFEELNAGLANVVPAASAAGIGFDEVAGTIAKLTTVGIPTAQATTQLRSAIVELQKPSKPLADALAKIGLNAANMGAELAKPREEGGGLVNVLQRLEKSATASGQSLTQIFGSAEAASAALAVTGANAESTNQILQNVGTDIADNVAGKAFESAAKSLDVQFRILQNQFQAAFNSIFQAVIPVITEVIGVITETVGPAFERTFGAVKDAFGNLFDLLKPILVGIGGAILAGIVQVLQRVAETARVVFQVLANAFQTVKDALAPVIDAFGLFNESGESSVDFVQIFKDALTVVGEVLQTVADILIAVFTVAIEIATVPLRIIGSVIAGVVDFFKDLFGVTGDVGAAFQSSGTFVERLRKFLEQVRDSAAGVVAVFRFLKDTVAEFFRALASFDLQKALAAFSGLGEGIKKAFKGGAEEAAKARKEAEAAEAAAKAAEEAAKAREEAEARAGTRKQLTQLQKALAAYKQIESQNKILLEQDLKRIELQRDLSDEQKKAAQEAAKGAAARTLQDEAQKIFKATLDEFGLFVESGLKLVGDESETEIIQIFTRLAQAVPEIPLLVNPEEGIRRVEADLSEFRPAVPISLEVTEEQTDRVEQTIGSLSQRLAEGLAGIFKTSTNTQADELQAQEDNLKAQLKRNEISYQEYTSKLGDIDAQRTDTALSFSAALTAGLGAVGETASALAAASFDKVGKSAEAAYKLAFEGANLSKDEQDKLKAQTITVSATFEELGVAAGATFAGMVADGASATDALAETLKQTLKAAVSAFIPTIFANFLAFIPPPFNVAAATAAVGILNGLIDRYLAFEQGGLVPGGEQLIRVNEAGNEFVMNARATRKYLPMLEAMNSGRDVSMVGSDMLATLDTRLERVENAIRGLGAEINRRTRVEGELVFSGGAQTLVGTFDTISTYNKRRRLK